MQYVLCICIKIIISSGIQTMLRAGEEAEVVIGGYTRNYVKKPEMI